MAIKGVARQQKVAIEIRQTSVPPKGATQSNWNKAGANQTDTTLAGKTRNEGRFGGTSKSFSVSKANLEGPIPDDDDESLRDKDGPSLHTRYPRHKSKPVENPRKEYENVWDTSLFYPATIGAKVGLPPTEEIKNLKIRQQRRAAAMMQTLPA